MDNRSPRTPRFNMAFELGLTVALERTEFPEHAWVVCESRHHRIQKSLSDLNGTDPYIHDGTIRGVFRVFGSIFVRSHRQPTVPQMRRIYRALRLSFDDILDRAGESSAFQCAGISRSVRSRQRDCGSARQRLILACELFSAATQGFLRKRAPMRGLNLFLWLTAGLKSRPPHETPRAGAPAPR